MNIAKLTTTSYGQGKKQEKKKKAKGGICKMLSNDSKLFIEIDQKLDQFHENI